MKNYYMETKFDNRFLHNHEQKSIQFFSQPTNVWSVRMTINK